MGGDDRAARSGPEAQCVKAEQDEHKVRELGDAGLFDHARKLRAKVRAQLFGGDELGDDLAHVGHLVLPLVHAQKAEELCFPARAAVGEFVAVEPGFWQQPPDEKRHDG